MQRDTTAGTFLVATVLCVVCSFLVAGTANVLGSKIGENKVLDRKKNVLLAAKLVEPDATAAEVNEVYSDQIDDIMVDLATGQVISKEDLPEGYDPKKAANNPELNVPVENNALMGIKNREPYAQVYKIQSGGYVLPVYGKGLWGTLWGFLALNDDAQTIKGITFYEHKETPGLGAEVDNPIWKAKWPGKLGIDDSGEVKIGVKKGTVAPDSEAANYTVDGLSGATITTKGVDHLVTYWLGDEGFGKYLAKKRQHEPQANDSATH